jgi:hypothetical protein
MEWDVIINRNIEEARKNKESKSEKLPIYINVHTDYKKDCPPLRVIVTFPDKTRTLYDLSDLPRAIMDLEGEIYWFGKPNVQIDWLPAITLHEYSNEIIKAVGNKDYDGAVRGIGRMMGHLGDIAAKVNPNLRSTVSMSYGDEKKIYLEVHSFGIELKFDMKKPGVVKYTEKKWIVDIKTGELQGNNNFDSIGLNKSDFDAALSQLCNTGKDKDGKVFVKSNGKVYCAFKLYDNDYVTLQEVVSDRFIPLAVLNNVMQQIAKRLANCRTEDMTGIGLQHRIELMESR